MRVSTRHIEPLLPGGVPYATPVADTVSLADAVTITWVQDRAGDTVTLSDSLSRAVTAARSVADSVALSDSVTTNKGKSVSISDAVVLSDARSYARGLGLADSLVGEAYGGGAYGGGAYGYEGIVDAISTVHAMPRSVTDSLSLSDAVGLGQGESIADSVSLADSISASRGRSANIADSVLVDDLFNRVATYARTPADGLVLADQTLDGQGIGIADLVALADAISGTRGLAFSDSLALADQFSRIAVYLRAVTDAVALSDSVTQEKTSASVLNLSDAVAISDAFSRVAAANRTVADSLALADALSAAKVLALALSSVVVTTDDVFNRAVAYARIPADSLALLDQLTTSSAGALGLSDLVALSDDQIVTLTSLSTILDAVYTGRIAMGVNGDNDAPEQGEISDTVGGVIEEELVEV